MITVPVHEQPQPGDWTLKTANGIVYISDRDIPEKVRAAFAPTLTGMSAHPDTPADVDGSEEGLRHRFEKHVIDQSDNFLTRLTGELIVFHDAYDSTDWPNPVEVARCRATGCREWFAEGSPSMIADEAVSHIRDTHIVLAESRDTLAMADRFHREHERQAELAERDTTIFGLTIPATAPISDVHETGTDSQDGDAPDTTAANPCTCTYPLGAICTIHSNDLLKLIKQYGNRRADAAYTDSKHDNRFTDSQTFETAANATLERIITLLDQTSPTTPHQPEQFNPLDMSHYITQEALLADVPADQAAEIVTTTRNYRTGNQ